MEVCLARHVSQTSTNITSYSRLLRIKGSGNPSDKADRCGVRKAQDPLQLHMSRTQVLFLLVPTTVVILATTLSSHGVQFTLSHSLH